MRVEVTGATGFIGSTVTRLLRFLAGGVALLSAFASWQARAASPLLPPRVMLDRNRGAASLAVLIASAGIFGIFLFLIYYLQQTLGYSPVVSGVAFLPMIAMVVAANLANVALLPRLGPKPLVTAGLLLAAGRLLWLTRIGVHRHPCRPVVVTRRRPDLGRRA